MIVDMDFVRLGKKLSYYLRHDRDWDPQPGGWRTFEELASFGFTPEEILKAHAIDKKGRYQLDVDNHRIRAIYGHSRPVILNLQTFNPPEFLYHGTVRSVVNSIIEYGLRPRSRNYVHLTENISMAEEVARRHGTDIVILRIAAASMANLNQDFFNPIPGVWLVSAVTPEFIKIL